MSIVAEVFARVVLTVRIYLGSQCPEVDSGHYFCCASSPGEMSDVPLYRFYQTDEGF